MLADSLMECYTLSVKAGTPLALRVFVSGRGRLEDEGAKALSKAFKVFEHFFFIFLMLGLALNCLS